MLASSADAGIQSAPESLYHRFLLRTSFVLVTASCHFLVADVIFRKGRQGSL